MSEDITREGAGQIRARKGGKGHLDWETGRFSMILATDKEASDGHILSMRGAELPEQMPLLVQHSPQVMIPALGSVVDLKPRTHQLDAVGHVELGGAGDDARDDGAPSFNDPLREIRAGYAHLIDKGHISSVSIRWEGDSVPRTSLKASHPAYIDGTDETLPPEQRYGRFFTKWRALEGSVVAIGADPLAAIRARASDEEVGDVERLYWGSVARAHESGDESPDMLAAMQAISEGADILRAAGLEPADLARVLVNFGGIADDALDNSPVRVTVRGRVELVSRDCFEQLTGESLDRYREALHLTGAARSAPPVSPEGDDPPEPEGSRAAATHTQRVTEPGLLSLSDEDRRALTQGILGGVSQALGDGFRGLRRN